MRTTACLVVALGLVACGSKSEEATTSKTTESAGAKSSATAAAKAPEAWSNAAAATPPASGAATAASANDYHGKEGKYRFAIPCQTGPTQVDAGNSGWTRKETFDCQGSGTSIMVQWNDAAEAYDACVKDSEEASALKTYKLESKGDLPNGRGRFWKLRDGSTLKEWTCIKGPRTYGCEAGYEAKEPNAAQFVASCETVQAE